MANMTDAENRAHKDYRLELFLSVDVAGSTSFKFSKELADNADGKNTGWFSVIRKFYVDFHETFLSSIAKTSEALAPILWKALGDELIYRITIEDKHSAAQVTLAFIQSVYETRKVVRRLSRSLDLKASAWVADFHARNAVIDFAGFTDRLQKLDGKKENAPQEGIMEDFIGPSMDTGFRLGKVTSRRKMALSIELALVLAKAQSDKRHYPFIFGYDGREDLKGVLGGESYPVIWLDIEDDPARRAANRREAGLLQRQPEVSAEAVVDFCESFIVSSYWMELPFLKSEAADFSKVPKSALDHARQCIEQEGKEKALYSQENLPDSEASSDVTIEELLDWMPDADTVADEISNSLAEALEGVNK